MQSTKDFLIRCYAGFCALCVISLIFTLCYFLISQGISHVDLAFLTQNPAGEILGERGGIRDAILGSGLLMLFSILFSGMLGISCALYRQVYCQSPFIYTALHFIIRSLAAIPSILLGLFVYGFFIVHLDIPRSLFTASIALSLMVFPFVEVSVEKIIQELDPRLIRDSATLGVDKTYMCRKLILPVIQKQIVAVLILAGSYAVGATAPLLLTGVVFIAAPSGLFSPVMALPFHLHMLLNQSVATEQAYATALVLICLLILLHLMAIFIMNNLGGKLVRYFKHKKS